MEIERKLSRSTKDAYLLRPTSNDLGARRRTYRGRPLLWRDLLFIFLPATCSVFFPLVYGIWIFNKNYLQYGPIAAEFWSLPWIILAILSMLCLLLLAAIRIFQAQLYVSIYQYGLSIKLYPFRKKILKWSEISEITTIFNKKTFIGCVLQNKLSIILCSTNGNSILLDHRIRDITELAKEIKKNIYRRLLPILTRDFNQGRRLDFGPISINQEWISLHKTRISWRYVSKVLVKSGFLVIETENDNNLQIKTSQIPNLELLFLLIPRGISS